MKKQSKNVNNSSQNRRFVPGRAEFSMNFSEDQMRIDTDPYGSYTGVPDDPYDEPVQDVDDL